MKLQMSKRGPGLCRLTALLIAAGCIAPTAWALTNVIVGDAGFDSFVLNGGTQNVAGTLILGNQFSGDGLYTISGDTAITSVTFLPGGNAGSPNGALIVGNAGSGSFVQGLADLSDSLNQVNVAGDLTLGHQFGSIGTYVLNTGTLTVGGQLAVGGNSTGANSFTQNAGTLFLSGAAQPTNPDYVSIGPGFSPYGGTLSIGGGIGSGGDNSNNYGTGTYTLNGGIIQVSNNLQIGGTGTGTLNQNDGFVITYFLNLGFEGDGTYNLKNGTVIAFSSTVGSYGTGAFNQTDGTVIISTTLAIADNCCSFGTGQGIYTITGGTLTTGDTLVGNTGLGAFNQSGGLHTTNNLVIGNFLGAYTQTAGLTTVGSGYDGQILANGQVVGTAAAGTLTIGAGPGSQGQYDLGLSGQTNNIAWGGYPGSTPGGFPPSFDDLANAPYLQVYGTVILGRDVGDPGAQGGFNIQGDGTTLRVGFLEKPGVLPGDPPILTQGDLVIGQNGSGSFIQSDASTVNVDGMISIGQGVGGIGSYDMNNGVLTVGKHIIVGGDGSGLFTLNSGTVNVIDTLFVGGWTDTSGPVDVNHFGQGTFTQNGGTVTTTNLQVGRGPDAVYNLNGGTLDVGFGSLGSCNTGTVFNQTGGTLNAGDFFVGNCGGAPLVTYNLSETTGPAEVNIGSLVVGGFAKGLLNQSAGAVTVTNDLIVGDGPYLGDPLLRGGEYQLNGGNVVVLGQLVIGNGNDGFAGEPGGKGTFTQTGGGVTVTGGVLVGKFGSIAGGTGTYTMGGTGFMVANGGMVIGQQGATGDFIQNSAASSVVVNGFLIIGEDLGANGSYTLSAGTVTASNTILGGGLVSTPFSGGTGFFNQSGGIFQTGFLNMGGGGFTQKGDGTYYMTGGDLIVEFSLNMGNDVGGVALFVQTGGGVLVNGTAAGNNGLYINYGNYLLSGTGTLGVANNLIVGGIPFFGGWFIQSESSQVSVANDLFIGAPANSIGEYELSGALSTLHVTGNVVVGGQGNGTFTQVAGTHTVGGLLTIGQSAGAVGNYDLQGGTLNNAIIVGDAGTGSFFNSGGTHNVTGDLSLGKQGSGIGSYNLSGTGQLQVIGNAYVGEVGVGSFTQSAGTVATITNDLSVGRFNTVTPSTFTMTGGSLTTGRTIVGEAGLGQFSQTGGTQTITTANGGFGNLIIGFLAGSIGTFTLQNSTLNVATGVTIGDLGTGTFNLGGGGSVSVSAGTTTVGNESGSNGVLTVSAGGNWQSVGGIFIAAQSGSTGQLNVAGGALTAPSIINNDQLNFSGGSIAANVTNNSAFNVSGGAPLTLTGNLTNVGGATTTLSVATPFTVTGTLTQALGASIVAGSNITVNQDYVNLGSGPANSYDRRAGVTGVGQIIGLNAAQTLTGDVSAAGANTFTLNIGNVRGGSGPVTKNFAIQNSGSGADIRGVVQTAAAGNITDARLSGTGATAAYFGPLVAGASSSNLQITFSGVAGVALSGQKVAVVSNFDNVATQIVNITGGLVSALAVGNATPNTPSPVDLGSFRIGVQGALQSFGVTNQTSGPTAEQLGIDSAAASSGFSASNALGAGLIGPGATLAGAFTARANGSGAAGVNTGTVTINYATDGTAIDASFLRQAANSQVIDVRATGYNMAVGSAAPSGPINLGNFHVGLAGGAAPQSQGIAITHTVAGPFTESLGVASAGVSNAAFTLTNNIGAGLVVAGATSSNALSLARTGGVAGVNTGSVNIQYTSDGTGTSGLAAINANSQAVSVNATGYRLATASVTPNPVSFGNVRINSLTDAALAVQNTAIGDIFSERLNASVGGATAGITSNNASFNLLAAQGTDSSSLRVGLDTSTAGAKNGTVSVALTSDGNGTSGLGTTALISQPVTVTGSVFRLATGDATAAPLDLGNFRLAAATGSGSFAVKNTAANDGFSEQLGIASVGTDTTKFTASNALGSSRVNAQITVFGAVTVGLGSGLTAGVNTGNVNIQYLSDGTLSGTGAPVNSNLQSLGVQATGWNSANGSAAPSPVNLGNFHVGLPGGAAPQSQNLAVSNSVGGSFTEGLGIASAGVTGAFTLTNNLGSSLVVAGATNATALNVARNGGVAGINTGTVSIQYTSDGAGTSGLGAINANSQAVSVNATGYRLASANLIGAVAFGNVHVGDVVTQALTITNTASNDGFSEKLNASFGSVTDPLITTNGGSISLLAAGSSNASSMVVGLNTLAAGAVNGSVKVLLKSDGNGTSGLGITNLPDQDVGVTGVISLSGGVFRLASASPVAPNPVNFGNVRINSGTDQALTITNTASNDGFSEKLNASIGVGSTGVTTNTGSFNLLAAQSTDSSSLRVGLDTTTAGAKSGSAAITLVSDGAGTSNLGQTPLMGQTVTITGSVFRLATGDATGAPLDLGNFRLAAATGSGSFAVKNTAASDGFSEQLGIASVGTDTTKFTASNALGSSRVNAQITVNGAVTVGLGSGLTAGVNTGNVSIQYLSDGAVSGTGAPINSNLQSVGVQATGWNSANGSAAPSPVNLGNFRVGQAGGAAPQSQAIAVSNTVAGPFTEGLGIASAGVTGAFTLTNNLGSNLVAAGTTSNAALNVARNGGSAGLNTGTVSIQYATDGLGTSGLAAINANNQSVSVNANGYNMAVGAATPDPIVMHRRVGEVAMQVLTVSNQATPSLFSEALNAAFSASAGDAGHNGGGISNLIAGGNNAAAMVVSLNTGTAGAKLGSVTLSYQTDGTGINGNSGLVAAAAGAQTVQVSGNVYTQAVAQVAPAAINFGIVHVGDVVAQRSVVVTNTAALTALNDRLTGGIGGASGQFSASGNLAVVGLAAQQTDNSSLKVGLNTSAAGNFNGSASVALNSHNADMADADLGSTTVNLLAQVNNYANLRFVSGSSGLSNNGGNLFTLDFGTVTQGSALLSATLRAMNAVTGLSDLADGDYCPTGQVCDTDSFTLVGLTDFLNLDAGQSTGDLSISLDPNGLGQFQDEIVLGWSGHNASGFRGAEAFLRLQIRALVVNSTANVPEPGNLLLVFTGLMLLGASAHCRARRKIIQ